MWRVWKQYVRAIILLAVVSLMGGTFSLAQVSVTMRITVDNRHRVFIGDHQAVRRIVATDWEWHSVGWETVETYHFEALPGEYVYVVGQDDGGAAMLLAIVHFGDIIVYSGVESQHTQWEVARVYRPTHDDTPPDVAEVNAWIASTDWEPPAVGELAGFYYGRFSAYRPARYIWKQPGGSQRPTDAWGFPNGYTGLGVPKWLYGSWHRTFPNTGTRYLLQPSACGADADCPCA
jgi:hypothetical protein